MQFCHGIFDKTQLTLDVKTMILKYLFVIHGFKSQLNFNKPTIIITRTHLRSIQDPVFMKS